MATVLVILAVVSGSALSAESPGKPRLRVFILAGQSNMEGKGAIKHLEQLLADPKTAATYEHLRDGKDWVKRKDVRIRFQERSGPLTVGYAKPENRFGPELQFGCLVGDALDEPVLLIKTAWGGRNLAVDFRSPSAGPGKYQRRNPETKELEPIPPTVYGTWYRAMLREVHETLADLDGHIPGYAGDGFEISGFVWFQGFNDIINGGFMAEYESNLRHLITDVRRDFGVPDLPVVIGELGEQGVEPDKRYAEKHFRFRAMQAAPSKDPSVKNVSFVKTSTYVIKDAERFDGGYHYGGRADTFFFIGDAFGKAALKMLADKPADHTASAAKAWQRIQTEWNARQ